MLGVQEFNIPPPLLYPTEVVFVINGFDLSTVTMAHPVGFRGSPSPETTKVVTSCEDILIRLPPQ